MSPAAKPATDRELRDGAEAIADATPPVDLPAPHVIEALRRVMRDLPGIGKDQTASAQQGGYAYRGIEQITQHTQPLFARHGIVFVPRVVSYEIRDIVVNGKPWTDTVELVEYDVYGPGGIEDRITVGPILAIGRDNSDKGANKCLTQALKYALLQALSIADSKDDGDGQTHEAEPPPPVGWGKEEARAHVLELCEGDRGKATEAWAAIGRTPWTADALTAAFETWVNQPKDEPRDEPSEGES